MPDPQHGVPGVRSPPSPVGSNTVSNDGPARPSSRRRSSTGKSWCASSSDSARWAWPAAAPATSRARSSAGTAAARRRPGDVAGHHLVLAGQRGKHLGVRGQQHRAERHGQQCSPAGAAPPAGRRGPSPRVATPGTGSTGSTAGSVVTPPATSTAAPELPAGPGAASPRSPGVRRLGTRVVAELPWRRLRRCMRARP